MNDLVEAAGSATACDALARIPRQDRLGLVGFYHDLKRLDPVRADARAYVAASNAAVQKLYRRASSPQAMQKALAFLSLESLRQTIHLSIGQDDPAWIRFENLARSVHFMSSLSTRGVYEVSGKLRLRVAQWSQAKKKAAAAALEQGISQQAAASALLDIAKADAAQLQIGEVERDLAIAVGATVARAQEDFNFYFRQPIFMASGLAVAVGITYVSVFAVPTAGAAFGILGWVSSAAVFGAVGAAPVPALLEMNQMFNAAMVRSRLRGTAIQCELLAIQAAHPHAMSNALMSGLIAGAGMGLKAGLVGFFLPLPVYLAATAAIALGTGVHAGRALYHIPEALRIRLAIDAFDEGYLMTEAGQWDLGIAKLREAQSLSRGHNGAVTALLTGLPLYASRREILHVWKASRDLIRAMIAQGADNAAVAQEVLDQMLRESRSQPQPVKQ